MLGLIATVIPVALVIVVVSLGVFRSHRRSGKSASEALLRSTGWLLLLAIPLWDAIPTWIAYEYYSRRMDGLTIQKSLERWKTENRGVAETLRPYVETDPRARGQTIAKNRSRFLINERFAYESTVKERLFLSVYATTLDIVDRQTGEILVRDG